MRVLLVRALARWGQTVTVNGEAVRAFLQPLEQREKAAPYDVEPLGAVDDRLWVYIGLRQVAPGDVIAWKGRRFTVRDSRPWYLGDRLSHWWAVLTAEKEAAE